MANQRAVRTSKERKLLSILRQRNKNDEQLSSDEVDQLIKLAARYKQQVTIKPRNRNGRRNT